LGETLGKEKPREAPTWTTKSDWELIEEYSRIVTLTPPRPEHTVRVRAILAELRRRARKQTAFSRWWLKEP
jgi:hypothetical protein